jgi:hypothetical protein
MRVRDFQRSRTPSVALATRVYLFPIQLLEEAERSRGRTILLRKQEYQEQSRSFVKTKA